MVKWKVPVVAVLAAVMSLLVAGPAAADSDRAIKGGNWGEIRTVGANSFNDVIVACDGEADGHYVFAQYFLVGSGITKYLYVFDLDGANNNSCGTEDWRGQPVWAEKVRICEQNEGCSDWAYIRPSSPAGVTVKSTS
jgi:hypothetical protein